MPNLSLNDYLFGPLDTEFCLYFYLLSVINYLIAVMFVLYLGYSLLMGGKKPVNYSTIAQGIFGSAIMYFQNRLLFSMCSRSEGLTVDPRNLKS